MQHISGVLDNFVRAGAGSGSDAAVDQDVTKQQVSVDQDVVKQQVSTEVEGAQLAMQKAQARFESSVAQIREFDQENDRASP